MEEGRFSVVERKYGRFYFFFVLSSRVVFDRSRNKRTNQNRRGIVISGKNPYLKARSGLAKSIHSVKNHNEFIVWTRIKKHSSIVENGLGAT